MVPYHRGIGLECEQGGGTCTVVHPVSGRVYDGVRFTSACNAYFQGMVADAATQACYLVQAACHGAGPPPGMGLHRNGGNWPGWVEALRGCHPVLFIHDEIILEAPIATAHLAAAALAAIMELAFRPFVPALESVVEAEPVLMRRWYKGAKPVHNDAGQLVPWEPKAVAA